MVAVSVTLSGLAALRHSAGVLTICRESILMERRGRCGSLPLSTPSTTGPRTTFLSGHRTETSQDLQRRLADDFTSQRCSYGGVGRVSPDSQVSKNPFSKFQIHPDKRLPHKSSTLPQTQSRPVPLRWAAWTNRSLNSEKNGRNGQSRFFLTGRGGSRERH